MESVDVSIIQISSRKQYGKGLCHVKFLGFVNVENIVWFLAKYEKFGIDLNSEW